MEALETEKQSLEENVRRTRSLMRAMQAELQRIHRDYGVASSTLQELAEGLREGGGGASVPGSASGSPAAVRTRPQAASGGTGGDGTWGSTGGSGAGGRAGAGFR